MQENEESVAFLGQGKDSRGDDSTESISETKKIHAVRLVCVTSRLIIAGQRREISTRKDKLAFSISEIETLGLYNNNSICHLVFRLRSSFQVVEWQGRGQSVHAAGVRRRRRALLLSKGGRKIRRAHELFLCGRNNLCPGLFAQQAYSLPGSQTGESSP